MKILVRAPNWIGDQILAYPFFYYLRKAFPKAQITSVCVPWVADIQFRDLVDEVVLMPKPLQQTLGARFFAVNQGAQKLRDLGPWDLGFSLPNSFSAAWLLWRAGVKQRFGYRTEMRGFLLNQGSNWQNASAHHRAQAYVDLLPKENRPSRPAREFWGIPAENELDPKESGECEKFDPLQSWPDGNPVEPPDHPFWVLAPGATADSRRWALDRFAMLARIILKETGMPGVVVGGPKEAALFAELKARVGSGLLDFTALGPVPSISKLFQNARFTVCNESGLSHVAALCGSRVQIICGAADPRRTRPIGPGRVQIMVNPVECWPCEKNTCVQTGTKLLQCLKGIEPEAVWEEIRRAKTAQT